MNTPKEKLVIGAGSEPEECVKIYQVIESNGEVQLHL